MWLTLWKAIPSQDNLKTFKKEITLGRKGGRGEYTLVWVSKCWQHICVTNNFSLRSYNGSPKALHRIFLFTMKMFLIITVVSQLCLWPQEGSGPQAGGTVTATWLIIPQGRCRCVWLIIACPGPSMCLVHSRCLMNILLMDPINGWVGGWTGGWMDR